MGSVECAQILLRQQPNATRRIRVEFPGREGTPFARECHIPAGIQFLLAQRGSIPIGDRIPLRMDHPGSTGEIRTDVGAVVRQYLIIQAAGSEQEEFLAAHQKDLSGLSSGNYIKYLPIIKTCDL